MPGKKIFITYYIGADDKKEKRSKRKVTANFTVRDHFFFPTFPQ
jgi:hypothetical protein